jgi:Tfp pilus assembly protein PilF
MTIKQERLNMNRFFRGLILGLALLLAVVVGACGSMTPEEEKALAAEGHFRDGMKAFDKKDYPAARKEFTTAVSLDKKNTKAANALAWVNQLLAGKDGVAKNDSTPEDDRLNPIALENPFEKEDTDQSLIVPPGMITDKEPIEFWQAFMDGMDAYHRGDFSSLLASSEEALKYLDPSSEYYFEVSKARLLGLVMSEDYAGGAQAAGELIWRNQSDPLLLDMATMAFERSGQIDNALWTAEQSYRLDPTHPTAINNLAYTYAVAGQDLDYARALAEQALLIEPQSPAFLDTMGWILYQSGNPTDAFAYIKKALELAPNGPDREEIIRHYQTILNQKN